MTKKQFISLVVVGGFLGLTSLLIKQAYPQEMVEYFYFPLVPIGLLLRKMSLAGSFGNAIAFGLYLLISLAPIIWRFIRRRKQEFQGEEFLLIGLSGFLFWGLYAIINQQVVFQPLGKHGIDFSGFAINLTALSILTAYLALRLIRRIKTEDIAGLFSLAKAFLALLAGFVAFSLSGPMLANAISKWQVVSGNAGGLDFSSHIPGLYMYDPKIQLTEFMIGSQFLAQAISAAFTIYLCWLGFGLLEEVAIDLYGETVGPILDQLSKYSRIALIFTVAYQTIMNFSLILLSNQIYTYDFYFNLPLTTVAVVVISLIVTHYLKQMRQLKLDNEMII